MINDSIGSLKIPRHSVIWYQHASKLQRWHYAGVMLWAMIQAMSTTTINASRKILSIVDKQHIFPNNKARMKCPLLYPIAYQRITG